MKQKNKGIHHHIHKFAGHHVGTSVLASLFGVLALVLVMLVVSAAQQYASLYPLQSEAAFRSKPCTPSLLNPNKCSGGVPGGSSNGSTIACSPQITVVSPMNGAKLIKGRMVTVAVRASANCPIDNIKLTAGSFNVSGNVKTNATAGTAYFLGSWVPSSSEVGCNIPLSAVATGRQISSSSGVILGAFSVSASSKVNVFLDNSLNTNCL